MITDNLNNTSIRQYIPNVLSEVEGETPIYEKLKSFLESARLWLEHEFLGPDNFLSDAHNELALKILVAKAFADAVPSLDLSVTPSGFGVINADGLAPASKERIGRLIASLRTYVDVNIGVLVDICRTYEQWRSSERGQYFCSSFISSPSDLNHIYALSDVKRPPFSWLHENALLLEKEMAADYFGISVMSLLRNAFNDGRSDSYADIIANIRALILERLVDSYNGRRQRPLWDKAKYIVDDIRHHPLLGPLWMEEIGSSAKFDFRNDVKGAFFF